MKKEEALKLLKEKVKDSKIVKHCIAVAAIMRVIAKEIGKDEEKFEITGILHDIDYEETKENMVYHTIVAEKILSNSVDKEIIRAIKSHNYENTHIIPKTELEISLLVADALSGLLIACALIMPDKKISSVSISTVKKKFKKKDFARRVNRSRILLGETKLGIKLDRLFEISLNALKSISDELGL